MKQQLGHDVVIEQVHFQNDIMIADAQRQYFKRPFNIEQITNGYQLYALTVHEDGTKEPDDKPWEDQLLREGFFPGDKVFVTLTDSDGQKLTDDYRLR